MDLLLSFLAARQPGLPEALGELFGYAWLLLIAVGGLALLVLAPVLVRFFWYRHIYLGRSGALEELTTQVRRIADAIEGRQAVAPGERQADKKPDGRHVSTSMFGR